MPKENRILNYRLIGFICEKEKKSSTYKVEIALGNYTSEDSFRQKITWSFLCDSNKIIGEVPFFGKQYTWRSATTVKDSATYYSELHHFSILASKITDTSITRLRISVDSGKYQDAYVFLDGTRGLYDMKGNLIWFLPEIEGRSSFTFDNFGDLKATRQNTLTFMSNRTGGQVYETDYNGAVLWKGPDNGAISGDSTEYYHHEFTRLANGHYMALGSEYVAWKLPSIVDTNFLRSRGKNKKVAWNDSAKAFYEKMHFGTLIEYDATGKVIWSWKSSKYFKTADVFMRTAPHGAYYVNDVHTNGFWFDRKSKAIYVSFKGISRVVKVKYPEGIVSGIYGKKYDRNSINGYGPDFFVQQHNCRISKEGYLYLFNNNDRKPGTLPTLVMMKLPVTARDSLTKVWEYTCTVDDANTDRRQFSFSSGGSVSQMPDGAMFASMSGPEYTKVFIVNRKKEVLWSAMPETKSDRDNKWHAIMQYRASIIIRRELEQLIWNQR